MIDGGGTPDHSNAIEFGDLDVLDAPAAWTVAFKIFLNNAPSTAVTVFGKQNSGQTTGWGFHLLGGGSSGVIRVRHNGVNKSLSNTPLIDGELYSIILSWDGAEIFRDIAGYITETGIDTYATSITANATNWMLLNLEGLGDGVDGALGQVMAWPIPSLSESERQQYHDGVIVPKASALAFWHRGIAVPGVDDVGGTTPTEQGTVNLLSNDVDNMFSEQTLSPEVEIASRLLRRRRFPEERYSSIVVPEFLSLELGDRINVAHDSMILPTTITDIFDSGEPVVANWARSLGRVSSLSTQPSKAQIPIGYIADDFYGCSFWSTDRVNDIADTLPGLAMLEPGAVKTFTRGTIKYLPGPDTGQAHIGPAVEAMNQIGYLAEDGITNDVDDSANISTLSGSAWTIVEDTVNNILNGARTLAAFRLGDVAGFYFSIRKQSGDNYIWQTISTVSTDGYRNVSVLYSRTDSTSTCHVACQRSDNSEWWNNATKAWQVSKVWNELTTPDSAIWIEDGLEPLEIDWTGTLRIEVGMPAAAANGDALAVGNVQCTLGPYRYSQIPTTLDGDRSIPSGTQSQPSVEDVRKFVLDLDHADPFRQVGSPDRGQFRFKVTPRQKASWMEDGDQFIFFCQQYGSSTDDRDVIMYEKQTGENARFSIRRYTGGVLRARAYKEYDIDIGVPVVVSVVWVSSEGELDMPALSCRVTVDGVRGVDAVSSAIPSNAELHSELWVGCQPTALGGLRAMNYLSDWEELLRVHPDEQWQAYR